MKKILFIIVNAITLLSSAQVVISKANLYVSPGIEGTLDMPGLINSPSVGANQNWNLSAISSGNLSYLYYEAGTSTFFPEAVSKMEDDISVGGAFTIPGTKYYGSVDAGFGIIGVSVSQTTVPIDGITGNPGDKITFDEQNDVQNSFSIPFPLTYQGKYKTVNRMSLDGGISVAALSLNGAPFAYVEHTIFEDTVSAWGIMRVPHPVKSSTRDYEVLRVDRKVTIIDSVYINGVAASAALLAQFGLTQGRTQVYYRSQFFSPNSKNYILRINYQSDASFTTPYNAFCNANTNALNLQDENPASLRVYPNPMSGKMLFLNNELLSQASLFRLYDNKGHLIIQRELNGQTLQEIELPQMLASGLYSVQISSPEGIIFNEKIIQP